MTHRTVVANPFTPIPVNPRSHVRGWAQHWAGIRDGAEVLGKEDSALDADYYLLDHGVNSVPGVLNLFGGVTEDVVDRLEEMLISTDTELWSLDVPMPADEYCRGLLKRIGQKTCSPRLTESFVNALRDEVFAGARWTSQEDYIPVHRQAVVGDSHATSYAPHAVPVIRWNGATLFGSLRSGRYREEVARLAEAFPQLERVTLVGGSVDVRHHVGRQDDPEAAVMKLVEDYVREAEFISSENMVEVVLGCPVPVEHEARRIPKTGWHDGAPFTGTAQCRRWWTDGFNSFLRDSWPLVVSPPQSWYEMDGEAYAREHMELSSSVHIAPTSYRSRGGWEEPD